MKERASETYRLRGKAKKVEGKQGLGMRLCGRVHDLHVALTSTAGTAIKNNNE